MATIKALLSMLILIQIYQLIQATAKIPNHHHDETLHRWDCLYSNKGGKVTWGSQDINPCYCKKGGEKGSLVQNEDGSIMCATDIQVSKYADSSRDCANAKGPVCSKSSPCTPCGLSRSEEFGERWERCRPCNYPSDRKCDFVKGVGPYCYKSVTSREVVPCNECCTEQMQQFDSKGICY